MDINMLLIVLSSIVIGAGMVYEYITKYERGVYEQAKIYLNYVHTRQSMGLSSLSVQSLDSLDSFC